MDKVFNDKRAIFLFIFPAALFFVGILLLPILFSGYYSMLEWDGIGKGIFVGFQNYVEMAGDLISNDEGFRTAVLNSIYLVLLSVFIQLPIAFFLAVILANGIKGESFFRSVYFIPVIISTVVIGQLWSKIYHPSYGLLNVLFEQLGVPGLKQEWLGDTETALFAVFVPLIWQYIGYHMLLMYAGIKSIPNELHEAAMIDGAGVVSRVLHVTIPLIMPIIEVSVIFAIIGSLKSFDLIYVLTNGGPLHATEMPTTLMFSTIFHKYRYGFGSAIAIFIIIECFIFTVLVRKVFTQGTREA